MVTFLRLVAPALMLAFAAALANAGDHSAISIEDPYARSGHPGAKAGAAFMVIKNSADTDDRLLSASYAEAALVELHKHQMTDGVMQMVEIEGGIPVPAGGEARLERGGNHVMLMGLTTTWPDDTQIEVTLTFEQAGEIVVAVPIDRTR